MIEENLEGYAKSQIDKALSYSEGKRQEQGEPVAWINKERNTITWDKLYADMDALYTTPQTKEWVGLTYEEVQEILLDPKFQLKPLIAHAVEAKLKEKNT